MNDEHQMVRGWLQFLIIFLGLATAFLIWWFMIRNSTPPQDVTTVTLDVEEAERDDAPESFDWYHNEEQDLHFLHPEGWNLFKREFGNTQNVDKADVPLTASDFDLSYFANKDARILLNLPKERFCQETTNIRVWKAFEGGRSPRAVNDARCTKPELLLINGHLSPAFADDGESIFRYGIYLPFKDGGGLAFNDSVPIPENATVTSKGKIVDEMKEKLRKRVSSFTSQNQQLLPAPQPSQEEGIEN